MALLTNNNCVVDSHSGGVVFKGSPEMRAIRQLQTEINSLSKKVDLLVELLKGADDNGRKMAPL